MRIHVMCTMINGSKAEFNTSDYPTLEHAREAFNYALINKVPITSMGKADVLMINTAHVLAIMVTEV